MKTTNNHDRPSTLMNTVAIAAIIISLLAVGNATGVISVARSQNQDSAMMDKKGIDAGRADIHLEGVRPGQATQPHPPLAKGSR